MLKQKMNGGNSYSIVRQENSCSGIDMLYQFQTSDTMHSFL